MSITGSTNVINSNLKIDNDFMTLTPLRSILTGSLDSNFLVGKYTTAIFLKHFLVSIYINYFFCFIFLDVIGRAIDIGQVHAVQVGGKPKKRLELMLTDTE